MTVDTCSTGATSANGRLQIFGGLAGKKIIWKRNFGTLDANASVYSRTTPGNTGQCAVNSVFTSLTTGTTDEKLDQALRDCSAERVRFMPSYYFNNPFLETTGSGISNLPISTVELSPIY